MGRISYCHGLDCNSIQHDEQDHSTVGTYLKHLRGAYNRLSSHITFRNHHLLSQEYLTRRNLDTQIATGNHHSITLLQNLIKVCYTLFVFNFHDDLDVGTIGPEDFTNLLDVISATNERGEDHIDVIFDTEEKIIFVFGGESWKVNVCLGKIDAFSRGKDTIVQTADFEVRAINGKNEQRQYT